MGSSVALDLRVFWGKDNDHDFHSMSYYGAMKSLVQNQTQPFFICCKVSGIRLNLMSLSFVLTVEERPFRAAS
jgi:hypothetical protein